MIKFFKKYYFIILPLITTAYMLLQGIPLSTVDDCFMMEIAKSFQTNPHSEYLKFISIIHGYVLKFFYNIIPSVNWFAVLYLFTIGIPFVLFYKITQNYKNKPFFVILALLLHIAVLSRITFTIISFICSTAAVLWALEYVKEINRASIKHLILVFLLFFLSFSLRTGSVFICILTIFLPIYFFSIKERRNSVFVIATILGFCFIANYTNVWIKQEYKESIPDETYYKQFNEYRAKVSDTPAIDYEKNKAELDKIGITKNDLELFSKRKYADIDIFSSENLKKIYELQTFSNRYLLDISEIVIIKSSALVLASLFVIALFSFIYFKNRRKEIFSFSVFLFGAIAYLFFRKRPVFRVLFAINVLGVMTFAYIAMQELKNKIDLNKIIKRLAIAMLIASFIVITLSNIINVNSHKKDESDAKIVAEYVNSNKDKKYITDEKGRADWAPVLLSLRTNETFIPPANIFGDWYVYTPFWYDHLEQLGLSQYKDCAFKAVLDENVRVVSVDNGQMADQISTFLNEHYDLPVKYEIEDTIPGTDHTIYKFSISD